MGLGTTQPGQHGPSVVSRCPCAGEAPFATPLIHSPPSSWCSRSRGAFSPAVPTSWQRGFLSSPLRPTDSVRFSLCSSQLTQHPYQLPISPSLSLSFFVLPSFCFVQSLSRVLFFKFLRDRERKDILKRERNENPQILDNFFPGNTGKFWYLEDFCIHFDTNVLILFAYALHLCQFADRLTIFSYKCWRLPVVTDLN